MSSSVLHYLAIRETTSARQFFEALKIRQDKPRQADCRCFLTLHILPVPADVWLFNLLVVGALPDPIGGNVYHSRCADHFDIEVPNSPQKRTCRLSASFARKQVVWSSSSPSSQTEETGPPLWTMTNYSIHVTFSMPWRRRCFCQGQSTSTESGWWNCSRNRTRPRRAAIEMSDLKHSFCRLLVEDIRGLQPPSNTEGTSRPRSHTTRKFIWTVPL